MNKNVKNVAVILINKMDFNCCTDKAPVIYVQLVHDKVISERKATYLTRAILNQINDSHTISNTNSCTHRIL